MANLYTYDDFIKAAQNSGIYNQFSDADLRLAQQNPEFGFYALNAKQQYAAADTPEARALINADLENKRRTLGGYTGGSDGSQYNPILNQNQTNPAIEDLTNQMTNYQDFSYDVTTPSFSDYGSYGKEAPAYENFVTTGAAPSFGNYGSFGKTAPTFDGYANYGEAPTFNDSYKQQYDQRLNNLSNYKDFSYDYKNDPLYAQYKQAYNREGQRATANALAESAAATGGIPSSYANTAAAQAGNYYAAQLADKIPDLYQIAYQQYADQYNRDQNALNNLMNARNFDFGTYQTSLGQYNADRNFALNRYNTDLGQFNADRNFDLSLYNTDLSQYNADRNFDMSRYLAELDQFNNDRNFDFNLYQTDLGQFNTDRNFNYGVYGDKYNRLGTNLATLLGQDQTAYSRDQDALAQQNWEREFGRQQDNDAYAREQTAMNDARSRIDAFLSAGGDIANLPADLKAASGLSDAELNALALSAAVSAGGRGRGTGTDTGANQNQILYGSPLGKQLVDMSANDPEMAATILSDNWDNLGYEVKFSLMQNMGYDNATAIQLAHGNDLNMALYPYGLNPTPKTDISSVIAQIKASGAASGMSSEEIAADISKVIAGTSGIGAEEKAALLSKYLPDYSGNTIRNPR